VRKLHNVDLSGWKTGEESAGMCGRRETMGWVKGKRVKQARNNVERAIEETNGQTDKAIQPQDSVGRQLGRASAPRAAQHARGSLKY
jgi:hypothetical protein